VTRRSARAPLHKGKTGEASSLVSSRLRTLGVVLLCGKVALIPLFFDRTADVPFSVAKALLSHALAYVLLGVLVALAIRFGRSFLTRSPLHVAVLTFLGVNAIASVFAVDPQLAFYGTHPRMLGLGTIADGVILYFAFVLLVRTRREALAVGSSILASSVIVLIYATLQLAERDPFEWNVSGSVRPFSTLGQTTSLAEYLAVLFIGALALAAFGLTLRRAFRVGVIVFALALFAGLLATQTRSALLGVVTGGALLLALVWTGHPDRRTRLATIGGALAAAVGLAAVLLLTPLGARVLSTVDLSVSAEGDGSTGPRLEQSADVRLAFYRMALGIVRERPIFGYGPDNFVIGVPTYRTAAEPFEVQQSLETSAHGWLSQIAATSGLVGLGAFLAMVIAALVLTVRAGFRPVAWLGAGMLAAFLGAGLTTVDELGTGWLFWTGLGTIGVVTSRPWPSDTSASESRPRGRGPADYTQGQRLLSNVGYVVVALTVLLALTTWNALDASHSAQASLQARLAGRNQQAIDLALRATNADPRRAAYWDTLGLAYVGGDRVTDAVAAFRRASDLAPYDFRYSGDLARAYAQAFQKGDRSASQPARDVAERVVKVDPNNPLTHLTRAVVMQVTGDLPEGLRSAERALELDQSHNRDIFLTATQVLIGLGRPADGVEMARRGIAVIPDPRNQLPLRVELARGLALNGQIIEALKEIDALLAIQPGYAPAQQLRTQIQAGVVR